MKIWLLKITMVLLWFVPNLSILFHYSFVLKCPILNPNWNIWFFFHLFWVLMTWIMLFSPHGMTFSLCYSKSYLSNETQAKYSFSIISLKYPPPVPLPPGIKLCLLWSLIALHICFLLYTLFLSCISVISVCVLSSVLIWISLRWEKQWTQIYVLMEPKTVNDI